MPTEHLVIQTVDADSLRRVISALGARGVAVQSIAATRSGAEPSSGYEIRLCADAPDPTSTELLVKRPNRLVTIVKTVQITSVGFHQRRAVMVRVNADAAARRHVLDVAGAFGAEVIEMNSASVTLGLFAGPQRIEDLLAMLADHPIAELTDTGVVALRRGRRRAPRSAISASRT